MALVDSLQAARAAHQQVQVLTAAAASASAVGNPVAAAELGAAAARVSSQAASDVSRFVGAGQPELASEARQIVRGRPWWHYALGVGLVLGAAAVYRRRRRS